MKRESRTNEKEQGKEGKLDTLDEEALEQVSGGEKDRMPDMFSEDGSRHCSCACAYSGSGGSSTSDNSSANYNGGSGGLTSR